MMSLPRHRVDDRTHRRPPGPSFRSRRPLGPLPSTRSFPPAGLGARRSVGWSPLAVSGGERTLCRAEHTRSSPRRKRPGPPGGRGASCVSDQLGDNAASQSRSRPLLNGPTVTSRALLVHVTQMPAPRSPRRHNGVGGFSHASIAAGASRLNALRSGCSVFRAGAGGRTRRQNLPPGYA